MTTPDPTLAYVAAPTRPKLSVLAVVSFALGAFFMLGLALFRIANPIIANLQTNLHSTVIVLGICGLLTVLPVLVVVVLGHLAIAATAPGKQRRGRGFAGAGISLGYALLLTYLVTLIAAAIATVGPHSTDFVSNFFYWV
jgi:hypothetical protein